METKTISENGLDGKTKIEIVNPDDIELVIFVFKHRSQVLALRAGEVFEKDHTVFTVNKGDKDTITRIDMNRNQYLRRKTDQIPKSV